ncbi:MAG: PP2C family protein-serine/threonine phosphatase [Bacteroidota bacterium]
MAALLGHFNRQSTSALLIRGYATIIMVTGVDYLTGPDLSFFIFYFFPIIVVSWYLGRRQGIAMAFAAAFATTIHDLFAMDSFSVTALHDVLRYWAFFQRSGVFLVVSVIVAALRSFDNEKREAEHKLAGEVQSFLFPQSSPSMDHFTCFGASRSFDHLSGDFFDLVRVGRHKLAIVVGDICGKGVSAALLMAYVQGVLRSHILLDGQSLGNLIRTVNRSLHLSTADDKFATLFIGVYDDESQELTYVNAGHDAPIVLRWNDPPRGTGWPLARQLRSAAESPLPENGVPTIIKLKAGGLLLGVDPAAEYVVDVQTLHSGDILVCDTDGVKEARNELGEMYGLERLAHVVSEHRERPSRRIYSQVLDDIERFVGTEPQFDDMTLVIGKVV